ncbi:MAG: hypothetical protein SGJ10_00960 [Bacteroidota bacterium]|nr:hypothetical protein [Bacteroidota bacterium]
MYENMKTIVNIITIVLIANSGSQAQELKPKKVQIELRDGTIRKAQLH